MRKHRIPRSRQVATCTFCHRPIDFPSGFFFDRGDGTLAHPDCQAYELECGTVPPGARLLHTCGEANCVNPAHLRLVAGEA